MSWSSPHLSSSAILTDSDSDDRCSLQMVLMVLERHGSGSYEKMNSDTNSFRYSQAAEMMGAALKHMCASANLLATGKPFAWKIIAEQLAKTIERLPDIDKIFEEEIRENQNSTKEMHNGVDESHKYSAHQHQRAIVTMAILASSISHTLVVQQLTMLVTSLTEEISYYQRPSVLPKDIFRAIKSRSINRSALFYESNKKYNALLKMQRNWTTQLGKLGRRATQLREWLSEYLPVLSLAKVLCTCSEWQTQLLRFIVRQSNLPSSLSDPRAVLSQSAQVCHNLGSLSIWWDKQLQPLRRPSHYQRHFWKYVAFTPSFTIFSISLYHHRNEIQGWFDNTIASLLEFGREHVTEPLANIYFAVFSNFRRHVVTTQEELAVSKYALATMLEQFGKQHSKRIAIIEGIPEKQLLAQLPARAAAGDVSIIMGVYSSEVASPIKNALFGQVIQCLLVQLQKLKVNAEAALLISDQVLRSNEVNLEILATIPAIMLGLSGLLGLRNLVNRWIRGKQSTHQAVTRTKAALRNIELLVIAQMRDQDARRGSMQDQHPTMMTRQHSLVIDDSFEHVTNEGDHISDDVNNVTGIQGEQLYEREIAPGPEAADFEMLISSLPTEYQPIGSATLTRDWHYGRLLVLLSDLHRAAWDLRSEIKAPLLMDTAILANWHYDNQQRLFIIAQMNRLL